MKSYSPSFPQSATVIIILCLLSLLVCVSQFFCPETKLLVKNYYMFCSNIKMREHGVQDLKLKIHYYN